MHLTLANLRRLDLWLSRKLGASGAAAVATSLCEACALEPALASEPARALALARYALYVGDEALPESDELDPALVELREAMAREPQLTALVDALRRTPLVVWQFEPRFGSVLVRRLGDPGGSACVVAPGDVHGAPLALRAPGWALGWLGGENAWRQELCVLARLESRAVLLVLDALEMLRVELSAPDAHGRFFGRDAESPWSRLADVLLEALALPEDPALAHAQVARRLADGRALDEADAARLVTVTERWPQVVLGSAALFREASAHGLRALTALLPSASPGDLPVPRLPPGAVLMEPLILVLEAVDLVPEKLGKRTPRLERRVRWSRELVASARSADELAALRRTLATARRVVLRSAYERHAATEAELEAELPFALLLGELGCHLDGSMPAARDEALLAGPLALLKLPREHAVFETVPAAAPIAAALRWADTLPSGAARASDAATLREAWWSYRAEQRWLATFHEAGRGAATLREALYLPSGVYTMVVHMIAQLGAPALRAQTLEAVSFGEGRTLGRTRKAIAALGGSECLGELPARADELLAVRGFGPSTMDDLAQSLFAHLRTWRGTATAVTEAARPLATRAEVEDGLAALEQLFGG